MVQQMQPLLNSTMSSPVVMMSSLSIPISPNSLTKTAVFKPCWLVSMWLSRVVLPLPKNPVMMVTGKPCLGASIAEEESEVTADCIAQMSETSENRDGEQVVVMVNALHCYRNVRSSYYHRSQIGCCCMSY